jgi:hypothetical protein
LFGSLESRADFGNAVPFVLWFNFIAGFVYIGIGESSKPSDGLRASFPSK